MLQVKAVQFLAFAFSIFAGMVCASQDAFAAPPLSVYGKLPGLERAAISPSGDHVALIGVLGEERKLIVLDKDKKALAAVPLGNAKIRSIYWAGEDHVLIYKSDTRNLSIDFVGDKIELYSMIVLPIRTGKFWHVFANNPMITGGVRGFHGIRQRDGKWYGYFGGIAFERVSRVLETLVSTEPVLFEVDLETQRATKIAPRADSWHRDWLVGPDGKVSATLDLFRDTGDWAIRNGAGTKLASGVAKLGDVEFQGFGATPNTFIYSVGDADKNREAHWFEVPLAGGQATEILADAAVGATYFDNRSRQFIGYKKEGDTPSYLFFKAYQQKVMTATQKAFPGLSVHLVDWNDRFDRLIVMTEGPGDPQTWWLVDIKTGDADVLGRSYPMKAQDVGPMQMIRYKAGDGMDIAAVLTLPPGRLAKDLPVVLLPHGGPAARDYPGFDWWAQAFASRGYAVLQPNFRGSTGYGNAFRAAGHGEWGGKMQSDLSDGLAHLVRQGIVDPKRACIMGASYGGYAALAGVTLQKGFYRCAVSVAGVGNVAKLANTKIRNSGDPMLRRWLAEEWGKGRNLAAVSPVRFVGDASAPILLVHGKDDVVVPYDQSNDMAVALRAAGKPVEFLTLPGEDHWMSRSETRLAMLEAAVAFVEKHNPPDPLK
jgi:dienelactone hydrolase